MREHRERLGAAAVLAAALTLAATCHREDECHDEGAQWCANNTPHSCVEASYQDPDDAESEDTYLKVEGGIRCDHYGAECIEASATIAYCAFMDVSCTGSTPSMCVDDVVADCTSHVHPTPVEDCADDGMVCSTAGPGLGAECVNP